MTDIDTPHRITVTIPADENEPVHVATFGAVHAARAQQIDAIYTWAVGRLPLCGHGRPDGWSVRIADLFYIDCGCCWFWRGVSVGVAGTVASILAGVVAWLALGALSRLDIGTALAGDQTGIVREASIAVLTIAVAVAMTASLAHSAVSALMSIANRASNAPQPTNEGE